MPHVSVQSIATRAEWPPTLFESLRETARLGKNDFAQSPEAELIFAHPDKNHTVASLATRTGTETNQFTINHEQH